MRKVQASLTRRGLLAGASAAIPAAPAWASIDFSSLEKRLAGGRLGVFALDTGSAQILGHRADERFAMASSFKSILAGAVLARVDAGLERLDRRVPYGRSDLLSHSPVLAPRVGAGHISIEDLCSATVRTSDNAAANLLLRGVGGPTGLTTWLQRIGDQTTRLDRYELALNTALPGDLRDTTTPRAIVQTHQRLLLGPLLSPTSRERLADWLHRADRGLNRLRKNIPADWRAGDKTGTGENGSVGDVAIFWRPRGAPILVSCYTHMGTATFAEREAIMADIGKAVVGAFA